MAFEKYNIRDFRDAMFSGNRDVIEDREYDLVYEEYIEQSGLYNKAEISLMKAIFILNTRVNTMRMFIKLNQMHIDALGYPYVKSFPIAERYGYRIDRGISAKDFLLMTNKIYKKESKYNDELSVKSKQLNDLHKGRKDIKQTREDFIRIVNSLGRVGYKIDWDKTTVEEFSIMIKQQEEYNEKIKRDAATRR